MFHFKRWHCFKLTFPVVKENITVHPRDVTVSTQCKRQHRLKDEKKKTKAGAPVRSAKIQSVEEWMGEAISVCVLITLKIMTPRKKESILHQKLQKSS